MDLLGYLSSFFGQSLIVIPAFLFVLTVVVFFHELGHFIVARWCGVTVRTFSVGFGPEIFGFYDKHGTRWRFAWIPLGGYVRFLDDMNAASVPDTDALEEMTAEERAGAFQAKSLPKRAAVVAAGPIANFILAIVIYAGLFSIVGQRVIEPRIDKVTPNSPAASVGLKAGDMVLEIDGQSIDSFVEIRRIEAINAEQPLQIVVLRDGRKLEFEAAPERKTVTSPLGDSAEMGVLGIERIFRPIIDRVSPGSAAEIAGFQPDDLILRIDGRQIESFTAMQQIVSGSADKQLAIVVQRAGNEITLQATPRNTEIKDRDGKMVTRGLLGIQRKDESVLERYDPITALWMGTRETYLIASHTLTYLGRIIRGRESADQLGGPIRIAQVSGQVAQLGFAALIGLTALLSVSIGLLNLFPVPILDGGHLLFYAIEAIRGRPLSPRTQEIGFRIGLVLIIMLMIFVTRNDLIYNNF